MKDHARQHSLNIAGAVIGVGLIGILAFVTWALVYIQIPQENHNVLTLVTGILSANVGMVVGFYYGSSVTNKKQAETIDKLAETTMTAQNMPAPVNPEPTVRLEPGESATVTADTK